MANDTRQPEHVPAATDNRHSGTPRAYLTRRYWFAASHRLHSHALSAEENARIYGKCNNPYGHGHNYALEVTVGGPLDAKTGMAANLVDIDRVIEEEILARFDHVNLNSGVDSFRGSVPTSENLCLEIYRLLCRRWPDEPGLAGTRIEKVRLEETRNNTFECGPGLDRGL